MGVGAIVLLVVGVLIEGFPIMTIRSWLIVVWLAVVNTAFAFTLWNHTLRTLPAMESSLINSTMSVQIPILAVLFLGGVADGACTDWAYYYHLGCFCGPVCGFATHEERIINCRCSLKLREDFQLTKGG